MDDCVDNVNCHSIQMESNEDSDDCTGSDSESPIENSSKASERCTLIRNDHANKTDVIYRRISSYMGDSRLFTELADFQFFASTKKSARQNKSLKRFLFLFGFASTLLILSQIYLTFYFDGSSYESKFFQRKVFFFSSHSPIKIIASFLFSFSVIVGMGSKSKPKYTILYFA